MKYVTLLSLLLFVVSCAPATMITPTENVYGGSNADVFAEVSRVIATQPFLDNQSGWVIDANDQVGGLVKAHINGPQCGWFGCFGDIVEQGVISVTFASKAADRTAISMSRSGDGDELMNRIQTTLEEKFGLLTP